MAIVGGGIVGLATAQELKQRNPSIKCIVLEKEGDLGFYSQLQCVSVCVCVNEIVWSFINLLFLFFACK